MRGWGGLGWRPFQAYHHVLQPLPRTDYQALVWNLFADVLVLDDFERLELRGRSFNLDDTYDLARGGAGAGQVCGIRDGTCAHQDDAEARGRDDDLGGRSGPCLESIHHGPPVRLI